MLRYSDIQQARRSMGICLQENVIYESLTVRDHLEIIAGLRGIEFQNRDADVLNFFNISY